MTHWFWRISGVRLLIFVWIGTIHVAKLLPSGISAKSPPSNCVNMAIVFFTYQGQSAQDNMDYDRQLSCGYRDGLLFRHYRWQTSGVTIPENREIPQMLQTYDVGIRPTGGGFCFIRQVIFCFLWWRLPMTHVFPNPCRRKWHGCQP